MIEDQQDGQPPRNRGPHVALAVICERALQEKDGVLSIIRIFDRLIIDTRGPSVPTSMPVVNHVFTMVINLRPDLARGRDTITVRPETPSGLRRDPISFPALFEEGERAVQFVLDLNFAFEEEGLYWFDVLLGPEEKWQMLTRVPLRVVYQPMTIGVGGPPS